MAPASPTRNPWVSLAMGLEAWDADLRAGAVGTEATNLPVLNIPAFLGARFTAAYLRLHKWYPMAGAPS